MPDDFLAHLKYGHCGDEALRMIAKAPDLYGEGLTPMGAKVTVLNVSIAIVLVM